MSAKDSKIVKTEPLDANKAKWINTVLTTYTDPLGKTRTWEHAERPTRPKGSDIDAVGMVAILEKESGTTTHLLPPYHDQNTRRRPPPQSRQVGSQAEWIGS